MSTVPFSRLNRESFSRVFIIGVPALARIGSDLNPRSRSTIWRRNSCRIAQRRSVQSADWRYSCNWGGDLYTSPDFPRRALLASRSAGIRVWMKGGNALVQHDISTFLMRSLPRPVYTRAFTCVSDCFSSVSRQGKRIGKCSTRLKRCYPELSSGAIIRNHNIYTVYIFVSRLI